MFTWHSTIYKQAVSHVYSKNTRTSVLIVEILRAHIFLSCLVVRRKRRIRGFWGTKIRKGVGKDMRRNC